MKLTDSLKDFTTQLFSLFTRLSEQEKKIAVGALTFISVMTLFSTAYFLSEALDETSQQITYKSAQLKDIMALRDQYKESERKNAQLRTQLEQNKLRLVSLIEEETKALQVKMDSVNTREQPLEAGFKAYIVEFRIAKISYDKMMALIEKLEATPGPVKVLRVAASLIRGDGSDLLDLELIVATYKAG